MGTSLPSMVGCLHLLTLPGLGKCPVVSMCHAICLRHSGHHSLGSCIESCAHSFFSGSVSEMDAAFCCWKATMCWASIRETKTKNGMGDCPACLLHSWIRSWAHKNCAIRADTEQYRATGILGKSRLFFCATYTKWWSRRLQLFWSPQNAQGPVQYPCCFSLL